MLENIKQTITRWDERNPWTNVYGLARSIIALSSLLTLLINHPSLIMKPASGISSYPACKMNLSLFCLGENNYMMLNLFQVGLHCHSGACCHWLAPQNHRGSALVCQLQSAVIADRHRRRRAGSSRHDLFIASHHADRSEKMALEYETYRGQKNTWKNNSFYFLFCDQNPSGGALFSLYRR